MVEEHQSDIFSAPSVTVLIFFIHIMLTDSYKKYCTVVFTKRMEHRSVNNN